MKAFGGRGMWFSGFFLACAARRVVEFSGVPEAGDVGEWGVGVYVRGSGECVGRIEIEVVAAAR